MNDERVRYYFALIKNDIVEKHGQMLHEEAWQWICINESISKSFIRFFSKDDYEKFLNLRNI